jgi:DNA-binding MarR family transcriptional regulator
MVRDAIDTTVTAERLRPVLLRLARELRKETEALGVTGRQAALLWLVREHPGLTLRELADLERISAPSLSAHVDRLERAGLLTRVRSSGDRRRVGLQLTPAGSALVRRVRTRRTTWLAQRLAALDEADVEAIERAIRPLLALLEGDRP